MGIDLGSDCLFDLVRDKKKVDEDKEVAHMKLAEEENLQAFPEDKRVTGGGASVVSNLTTATDSNSVANALEAGSAKKKLAAERVKNAELQEELRKLRRAQKKQDEKKSREEPTPSKGDDEPGTQDARQTRLSNLAVRNECNEDGMEVEGESSSEEDSAAGADEEVEGGNGDR